jgi:hypothetical protein
MADDNSGLDQGLYRPPKPTRSRKLRPCLSSPRPTLHRRAWRRTPTFWQNSTPPQLLNLVPRQAHLPLLTEAQTRRLCASFSTPPLATRRATQADSRLMPLARLRRRLIIRPNSRRLERHHHPPSTAPPPAPELTLAQTAPGRGAELPAKPRSSGWFHLEFRDPSGSDRAEYRPAWNWLGLAGGRCIGRSAGPRRQGESRKPWRRPWRTTTLTPTGR